MLKNISKMGSVLNKSAQKSISGGKAATDCMSHAHFCNDAHESNSAYYQCMASCGC